MVNMGNPWQITTFGPGTNNYAQALGSPTTAAVRALRSEVVSIKSNACIRFKYRLDTIANLAALHIYTVQVDSSVLHAEVGVYGNFHCSLFCLCSIRRLPVLPLQIELAFGL